LYKAPYKSTVGRSSKRKDFGLVVAMRYRSQIANTIIRTSITAAKATAYVGDFPATTNWNIDNATIGSRK
jgi:hypothetical protein